MNLWHFEEMPDNRPESRRVEPRLKVHQAGGRAGDVATTATEWTSPQTLEDQDVPNISGPWQTGPAVQHNGMAQKLTEGCFEAASGDQKQSQSGSSTQGLDNLCQQCSDIDLAKVFRGGYRAPHKVLDLCPVTNGHPKPLCPLCRLIAEAIHNPFCDPSLMTFHDTCGFCTPGVTNGESRLESFQLIADKVSPERQRDGMGHGKMADYQDTYLITSSVEHDVTFSKSKPQLDLQLLDTDYLEHGAFIALKVGRVDSSRSDSVAYYGSVYPAASGVSGYKSPARLLSSSFLDWRLLQSWFSNCQSHHVNCSSPSPQPQVHGFRLIDCNTRELVAPVPGTGYVALSYVWGAPEKNTQMRGPELGDKLSKAPLVIEDSITAVKRLGYRYLWVDRYNVLHEGTKLLLMLF